MKTMPFLTKTERKQMQQTIKGAFVSETPESAYDSQRNVLRHYQELSDGRQGLLALFGTIAIIILGFMVMG